MTEAGAIDASQAIDARIAVLDDWRGRALAHLRALILAADPAITEDIKWRKPTNPAGVPTWLCDGILCTGEVYRGSVKLTFAAGAALPDPAGVFNASLTGGTRRAIDLRENDVIDAAELTAIVRAAVAYNRARQRR